MGVSVWVGYPRSWTAGRVRAPQYVVLHYTAGSEGPTSSENGAAYDKNRTDGTSTHYFTDSAGPALQEVPDGDRSHAALYHGNEIGIHIEICGTRQSREQWLDPTSLATLQLTAALTREICERHGFALRHLSVAEVRAAYYDSAKPTGICDHWAITQAYPEDHGDHTDVGSDFPWDVFMQLVGTDEPEPSTPRKDRPVELIIQPADGSGIGLAWPDSRAKGWVYTNILPPGAGPAPGYDEALYVTTVVSSYVAAGAVDARGWGIPSWEGYIHLNAVPDPAVAVGDVVVSVPPLVVELAGTVH